MVSPSEEVLTAQREAKLRVPEASRAMRCERYSTLGGERAARSWRGVDDIDGIAELLVEERGQRADYLVVEQPAHHDYGTSWQALRAYGRLAVQTYSAAGQCLKHEQLVRLVDRVAEPLRSAMRSPFR